MRVFRSAPLALGSIAAAAILAGFVISYFIPDDEAEIAKTIEAFSLDDDPDLCLTAATQRYLEQITGLPGEAAVDGCAYSEEPEASRPDSVTVSEVEVDGGTATAEVTYDGSPFDRSTVAVALVETSGGWKLDRMLGFATLDRGGMRRGLAALYRGKPYAYPAQSASCVADSILRRSDDRVERLWISRDASGFVAIVLECDRESFERVMRTDLRGYGEPASLVRCFGAEAARRSDAELVELTLDPVAYAMVLIVCDRQGGLEAYREQLASDDYSAEEIDCVIAGIGELSDRELARTTVENEELDRIFGDCESENG